MGEYIHYTKEQIEAAKNADLAEYVRKHGFECEKAGREIHIKGYGGLYINPEKNVFSIFSQSKDDGSTAGGKGPLAFAQMVMGMSFREAMEDIVGKAEEIKQFTPKTALQEEKEFTMPEKSGSGYKNIYAYFINTRRISPETVKEFVNKGLIYPTVSKGISKTTGNEYQKINAVFLHFNEQGKPCGADIQGIDQNPEYRFKGCTAHDESDRGFVYSKGDPQKINTVYLFEAPIDLMSFVELHPEIENAKFAALGGLKPDTAEHYINSGMKVVSCVDNDAAGINFNNRVLFQKMQESIGLGENLKTHTIENGNIPLQYCSADVNGKEVAFCLSKSDYFTAQKLGNEMPKAAVSWINRSNFTVNRECAKAGVKDFNDLLKVKKGGKNFVKTVSKMSEWTQKVQEKAEERKMKIENPEPNKAQYIC